MLLVRVEKNAYFSQLRLMATSVSITLTANTEDETRGKKKKQLCLGLLQTSGQLCPMHEM